MTKYILILITLVTLTLTSCRKKVSYHKIKYQVTFLEIPDWFNSNHIEVYAKPSYIGDYNGDVNEYGNPIAPYINYNQTKDGLWEYEYWQLQDGDKVTFYLLAQLDYHYEIRIFIDDVEVSYMRVMISGTDYYDIIELEQNGLDDKLGDGFIEFTYRK